LATPLFTSVIYAAVADFYRKQVQTPKAYDKGERKRRRKERALKARQKAKETIRLEAQEEICKLLGGKVIDQGRC